MGYGERGRPKAELVLTDEERETLSRWARRAKSAQALALRSRIVLACAEGLTNKEVAARCGCRPPTVGKWRRRFVELRLDGLVDDPRPGRPPTITAEQVEDVVVATLESTPENATHWSRAKMAERSGLSKSTIGRIWKAFELKPHRADGFKLSNDPLFVDKVYDVVGLYLNPPEAAVVLCVDEKSQVQALARSQPAFPMMPGMPEKRTHDYVRHGTTSLFAAFNTADGTVISSLHRRHRTIEFKKFLTKIDAAGPRRPGRAPDLRQLRHPQEPRRQDLAGRTTRASTCTTPRPTPAGSTRSNGCSPTSPTTCCDAATTAASKHLEADIRAWVNDWNTNPKPFIWTKTADRSSNPSDDYLKRITGAGH